MLLECERRFGCGPSFHVPSVPHPFRSHILSSGSLSSAPGRAPRAVTSLPAQRAAEAGQQRVFDCLCRNRRGRRGHRNMPRPRIQVSSRLIASHRAATGSGCLTLQASGGRDLLQGGIIRLSVAVVQAHLRPSWSECATKDDVRGPQNCQREGLRKADATPVLLCADGEGEGAAVRPAAEPGGRAGGGSSSWRRDAG